MRRKAQPWTCRKCKTLNKPLTRRCASCHKPKPPKRKPRHMTALEISYEEYIALNGGEHCAICGKGPGSRRLDRDHCHVSHRPRGLLCARHNRLLTREWTPRLLRAAADYLELHGESDSSTSMEVTPHREVDSSL